MAAILRWSDRSTKRSITLKKQSVSIGKPLAKQSFAGALIRLNDSSVSQKHAVIRFDAMKRRYTITDLNGTGSKFNTYIQRSNPDGTYKNSLQLPHNQSYPLNPGDIIRVGQTRISFTVVPDQSTQGNSSGGAGAFVVFLFLLALIGAGVYSSQNNSTPQNNSISTPEKTLTAFCNAVKSGNYQTAYNQLSVHSRSQETEAQFASSLQQTASKQGGFKNCTVSGVKSKQTTATGTHTYTFANGKTASYLDSLVTEKSAWKIDSSKTAKIK
jgi:pSer/pThr/pTyr-binding forkhead associated (FHA) protein